jgi:rhomboid protease GluP
MRNRTATIVLVAALVVVFSCEVALGVAGNETMLLQLGALRTRGWSAIDWWRILTFSFLHLNALHLALNVVALYWIGGIVERRTGAAGMLAIFAGAGMASGVAGMLLGPVLPTTGVAVGASGAVFGLLTAAVVLLFRSDRPASERDRRLRVILTICLVMGIGISFLPGVSLAGHLGGLFGGLLIVQVLLLYATPP